MIELLSSLSGRLILSGYALFPFKTCLDYFYLRSSLLQKLFRYHIRPPTNDENKIHEMTLQCGLQYESHDVFTQDGYCITLHRVKKSFSDMSTRFNINPPQKTVLAFHGLMQDSESFLAGGCNSLAAVLASEEDCDVWLANSRGNRYSKTHSSYNETNHKFWDFSLDELIADVSLLIDYVRENCCIASRYGQLICIGFSQGSAVLCGGIASNPSLNSKISLLICLAPAVKPAGLAPSILVSIAETYPPLVRLLFGYGAMFRSVYMWQNILSASAFAAVCVRSMRYLFGWSCKQIAVDRRALLFQHIYSSSSVKCVEHWFQIISSRRLSPFSNSHTSSPASRHSASAYDLSLITCPVAIFSGGDDKLVLPEALREGVKNCVFYHVEQGYEHLDLIWADTAKSAIFSKLVKLIDAAVFNNAPLNE